MKCSSTLERLHTCACTCSHGFTVKTTGNGLALTTWRVFAFALDAFVRLSFLHKCTSALSRVHIRICVHTVFFVSVHPLTVEHWYTDAL